MVGKLVVATNKVVLDICFAPPPSVTSPTVSVDASYAHRRFILGINCMFINIVSVIGKWCGS